MIDINKIYTDFSHNCSLKRNAEITKINAFYDGYEKGITDFANKTEDAIKKDSEGD